MSGNPVSNVVPMPGSWPSPSPWPPAAVPPGCFSELARLNQCYNEVQMMEMILSKVVCDLAQNNAAFQQCLVNAIAASGSNVPLIGVTNGTDAQPGQVGQWVQYQVANIPVVAGAATTTPVTMGVLQPGDWDCFASLLDYAFSGGNQFVLNPEPAGFSTPMEGVAAVGAAQVQANTVIGVPARALISTPTLVVFSVTTNLEAGTIQPGQSATMIFQARRAR